MMVEKFGLGEGFVPQPVSESTIRAGRVDPLVKKTIFA